MTTPLPPAWAAKVWVEGPVLYVDCPMGEGLPSHRLCFPLDLNGMHRLRSLLQNRNAHSVLGTKGDMTQWQVDKLCPKPFKYDDRDVKKVKPKDKFTQQARAGAREVLRKFGLIGAVSR